MWVYKKDYPVLIDMEGFELMDGDECINPDEPADSAFRYINVYDEGDEWALRDDLGNVGSCKLIKDNMVNVIKVDWGFE